MSERGSLGHGLSMKIDKKGMKKRAPLGKRI